MERDPMEREPDGHRSIDLRPAGIDYRRLRPGAVLHIHLTADALAGADGCPELARVEGVGPVTLGQVQRFLGPSGCRIRVEPVLDPARVAPVDGYEIPQRLRDAVGARHLADTFPYGTSLTRSMDLDHTIAAQRGGATSRDNLTPLDRTHHRAKTLGGWAKRQPDAETCLWRSPHGWIYLVTNQGTLALGRTPYAKAAWQAARPKPTARTDKTDLPTGRLQRVTAAPGPPSLAGRHVNSDEVLAQPERGE